ncbi:hypothetical protein GOBAR_AA13110 [Gossypium barbadense]|uniref:DUF4283 domain-containing protein n=1 Tax=Gossypium barbadense TaxID=3634 RepID=A0A2P5XW05_GOSBA|nr:hypothetical protein GOBAR_AA13110 [Gossypium barbadense]
MLNSLCENVDPGLSTVEEMIPKKVRFRDKEKATSNDMLIELPLDQPTSWRDMLVSQSSKGDSNVDGKEVIDFLEGDIQKSVVNGMPSITFSDQIHQILIQGMNNNVILKLLGRNIGFLILQNKIYSIWRPSGPIHMMDIENDYFLVKFHNKLDCDKALSEGSWTIFGQYLTVQPWTRAFDSTQAYPSVVVAWIRLPALPSYLYNRKIITEIGELVGKVVKLDMNTDSRTRGLFARMAVYVNLEKPLVSQILGSFAPNSNSRPFAAPVVVPEQAIDEVILHDERETSVLQSTPSLKEVVRGEEVVEVGNLDSEKHTTVVFFENKEPLSMNTLLDQKGFLDSSKEMKFRSRSNKQNKRFHGTNVRFKNASSPRVFFKKSIENLAESISSISKENFGTGLFSRNDEKMKGCIIPKQYDY